MRSAVPATAALPVGFAGLLVIGVVTVAGDGRITATGVFVAAVVLVAACAFGAEPLAAPPLAVIGWLTVAGFSRPQYADLHLHGTGGPAAVLAGVAGVATTAGVVARRAGTARRRPAITLDGMTDGARGWRGPVGAGRRRAARGIAGEPRPQLGPAVGRRRVIGGFVLTLAGLPLLTALLALARSRLAFVDDVLLYLAVVVLITLVGGFWPAVAAAVGAALLLNWFFTPPLHTWTVDAPQNLLALLLFVTTAVAVSSVVHLSARHDALATARTADAETLSALARTVLGGDDSAVAVLRHLHEQFGLGAQLQERRHDGTWVTVAHRRFDPASSVTTLAAGPQLRLALSGDRTRVAPAVLAGYAAQAAAALERERLRIQAGQSEALAEGNRMRTALLAAVSHDLRTPLASVKAAVSTLRQDDVLWTAADQATLLAAIEEGADRLDALISNLLDMSRIQTGAVQPFLRAVSLDEVAPLLLRSIDGGDRMGLDIPEDLPLLATDPGLLERALANLAANALRHSPPNVPPTLRGRLSGDRVQIDVVDHGPGVPSAERERMFAPFQQLGDASTGGVGLGLAVARGFIEALGGTIAASSTSGGGLTMRVLLPAVTSRHIAAPSGQGSSA